MEHTDTVYLDIETIPSEESWVRQYVAENTKPPAQMKKQETIDKWIAEKKDAAIDENMAKCSFDGAMNHIICIAASTEGISGTVSFTIENVSEEKDMLEKFFEFLNEKTYPTLVGHNITGFDIKIIKQRAMILGVPIPSCLPINAKPWGLDPYDTMAQWDSKNYVSLDKLAKAFGLEGKGDIDGSMVWDMWKNKQYNEIAEYCRDDVRLVRSLYKRMRP